MLHSRMLRMKGFRELESSELETVTGGVVSFTDGTAQERRDGAIARAAQLQAETLAEQYGLLSDAGIIGDGGGGSAEGAGGSVITEDFNGDGVIDAISEVDADGNWISTVGLTEEYDNWIANNQTPDGYIPWHPDAMHSSAFADGITGTGDGDGSFYGGFGMALVTGGLFGLSEGGNSAAWVVGLGSTLEFGYSTDDDRAAEEADNTQFLYPNIDLTFDWSPLSDWTNFTIGLQVNTGFLWSIAEEHSEPEPEGTPPSQFETLPDTMEP